MGEGLESTGKADAGPIPSSRDLSGAGETLAEFFNLALDLLAIANTEGYFLKLNQSWKDTLGYSLEDLEGKRFLDLVHPDDVQATLDAVARLSAGERILSFTNRYRTKQGDYREIEWRSIPSGNLIFAAARDMTERNRSARELMEERSRLALFVDHAPAAVAMFDNEMRYLAVSRRWLTEYQLLGQKLIGRSHYEVFPNCPENWRAIHRRCLAGEVISNDHDIWRPAGWTQDQHLKWEVRPWFDAEGQIGGVMMFTQDITSSRLMQDNLGKQNAELDAALRELHQTRDFLAQTNEVANVGGWEFDPISQKITWTDVTRAIHGVDLNFTPTLAEGLSFYPEGEARDTIVKCVEASIRTGEPWEVSVDFQRADGGRRRVKVLGNAEIRDGVCIRLYGAIRDITEQWQLESKLREREAELIDAKHRAEAANIAKSAFLSNMSHEIRTPLNAIVGMTELLHQLDLPDDARSYAETIRTSSEALLGLINDILDFSKIEAGQMEIESTAIHLRSCLEASIDIVAAQAASKELDLAYWIDPAIPEYILGDQTRLRQIVVNLLSNAIKFTQNGEIYLRAVYCEQEKPSPDCLQITVKDTGIGIPPDRMDRLFQRFSQVDPSTARQFGGSGLGLAICHRLVHLMGGWIGVESEPGKGSLFTVKLPLRPATPSGIGPSPLRSPKARFDGFRVLIVDDNNTHRSILRSQTSGWGMIPVEVDTPAAALELLADETAPFDLAIVDGRMPEMDGIDLIRIIRRSFSGDKLPIVLLTSVGTAPGTIHPEDQAQVLIKPVKTKQLHQCLASLLYGGRIATPPQVDANAKRDNASLATRCPLRILVGEDNPVNQRVVGLLLQRLGYSVDFASDGNEVLAALAKSSFDVVLMDIQMPDMDGLEATRRIRQERESLTKPWIIALTANATQSDRIGVFNIGMNDYLSKPVKSGQLATALENAWVALRQGVNRPND